MYRLTIENGVGSSVLKHPFMCDRCSEEHWSIGDMGEGDPIERLAAYERTGLTPDEIHLLMNPPESIYIFDEECSGNNLLKLYIQPESPYIISSGFTWHTEDEFGDYADVPVPGLGEDYFLSEDEAIQYL